MAPRTDFPPIRACLFDMDGLLLDTEDLYTLCINLVLEKYQRPQLPWSIKAKLQGRPGPEATRIFHDWARLPLTHEEYVAQLFALQREHFTTAKPLPGVPQLLRDLVRTRYWKVSSSARNNDNDNDNADAEKKKQQQGGNQRVHIALATSSHQANYEIKTAHLGELFSAFPSARRVLGDDTRIPPGRGKPLPDIYLLALRTINESLAPGEAPVQPEECLVFEDSVAGVEAGRRAGMRVVWCPHPMLKQEYAGREAEVLAGRTGEGGEVDMHQLGELHDGWADYLPSLEDFPYANYGIVVPPVEIEDEPCMKEDGGAAGSDVQVVVAETA